MFYKAPNDKRVEKRKLNRVYLQGNRPVAMGKSPESQVLQEKHECLVGWYNSRSERVMLRKIKCHIAQSAN